MKLKTGNLLGFATFATIVITLAGHASAAKTWSGATSAAWATTTNWLEGALPGTTETVIFNGSSTLNLSAIDTGANRTIRGINFTNPSGPVTLLNNILTVGFGGIDVSAATQDLTISCPNIVIQTGAFHWSPPVGRTLTLSSVPHRNSPVTYGGGNNDNVGGTVRVSTTGTVKLTTPSQAIVTDGIMGGTPIALIGGGSNPYMSYGDSDWAATDASGVVIAASYVNSSVTPATTGNLNVDNDPTVAAVNPASIRFADIVTPHTVTISGTNTVTGRGILMAPGTLTSTITGGNLRPNRSSTAGCTFSFIQNSTAGDLIIGAGMGNASSSAPVSFAKSGAGKLIFTNTCGNSGRDFINEGTMQFGNGGTVGAPGAPASIVNNGSLVFNRSDTLGVITNISGTGPLTQIGTGELTLTTSISTFTGAVNINAGTLAVTTMANLGAGTAINIDNATFKFLGAIDPSARTIAIGTNGAIFDTVAQNITFAAAVGNGGAGNLTKAGVGSLALTQPAGWTGNTIINAGTLLANNTTGSATSGSVTINAGGLGGTGTVGGAVTTTSGSIITPGSGGVGTLAVGSLDIEFGAVVNLEFGAGNDKVNVTAPNGLLVNGGTVNLYQDGTNLSTPFSGTPGTYNLFQYTGTLGGATSNLSIGNPQPGKSYLFGTSGGFVTLTIADTGVNRNWITDGGGSWNSAPNWNGTVPNASQSVVNFITSLSAPSTVTLDGSKTVGNIVFTSATNGYTLASGTGGSLILANAGSDASLAVNAGDHTISAPVTLNNNLAVSLPLAGRSITFSGIISGSGKNITKTGLGDLNLLATNTFNGGVVLSGGSTTFAASGLGTGNIDLDDTTLVWNAGNTEDISSGGRLVNLVANTVTFDTNSNDVVIANAIGESGSAILAKAGFGKLTFGGDNTNYGGLTISAGEVQLGSGGTAGSVTGNILNNGDLTVDRSDTFALSNIISGTGAFNKLGANEVILSGVNTFSGDTFLTAGTLTIENALALQNSKLDYTDGILQFGTVTAATIGGFTGAKDLSLNNAASAGVALTVGGANGSGVYTGILSGAGSFTKAGTGTLILSGVNSYTGATNIANAGGTLQLTATIITNPDPDPPTIIPGSIATTSLGLGTGGTRFLVTGGSITSSTLSTIDSRGFNTTSGFNLQSGSAAFNGGIRNGGNSGGADGTLISVEGGTFTATDLTLQRTRSYNNLPQGPSTASGGYVETDASVTDGFVVSGGSAFLSGILMIGTSNSGASALFSGGTTTVAGVVTVGNNTASGRWNLLQVSGGTFTSTEAVTGVVLSPNAFVNLSMFKLTGGISTVQRVAFGATAGGAGTGVVWVKGGTLYVGTGGLVQDAPAFTSTVHFTSGTLGAAGDWVTALPATLDGAFVIMAANAANVAHNITIGGAITGTGSLTKSGAGTLTLNGVNTYTGSTNVTEGMLALTTDDVLSDTALVNIVTGATLNLNHSGTDSVSAFQIDGVDQGSGTFGGSGSGADHIVAQITGSGKLYVTPSDPFTPWVASFGLTGASALPGADPDGDGQINLLEFALNSSPTSSAVSGKVRSAIALVSGDYALTYTLPVRTGALFGGAAAQSATIDGITYRIEGSDELSVWNAMVISEVTPALSAGLPAPDAGWTYRTFRTPGAVTADPTDFIRAKISN